MNVPLFSLIFTCLTLFLQARPDAPARLRPPFLKKGDKVAVISPSYAPSGEKDTTVVAACRLMTSWGLVPVLGAHVYHPDSLQVDLGIKGKPLVNRLEDLRWALRDTSIKAIIPSRGGYGAIHLVDSLDLADFRAQPKWLTGYSDITNLHLASLAAGVMSIHGNMCVDFWRRGADNPGNRTLHSLLFGTLPAYHLPRNPLNVNGKASGVLVGGNMITLEALMGSSWDFPCDEPVILFLEEIEETMHAVDRLMNMLVKQGRLANVSGIIFGGFTACKPDLKFPSIEAMLRPYVENLGIPVCFGFPAGHVEINLPLIEGAQAELTVSDEGTLLEFLMP